MPGVGVLILCLYEVPGVGVLAAICGTYCLERFEQACIEKGLPSSSALKDL